MYGSLATRGILAAMLATAVAAVACSNGGPATTPVTPTASSASRVASTASGDGSHGGGNQGGGDRGRYPGPGRNDNDPNKGAIAAGSLTGSCTANSLAFRIGTTAIRTNAQTRFDDITCSALGAGAVIEVHGSPQPDGSLLASRIEPEE